MSNRQHRGHKNTTAWRHNPHSKKTDKIISSPNEGVCHHCWEKVEWRKKFRKYKPLTVPRRCDTCQLKTVRIAYHTLCQACATEKEICAICSKEGMSHPYVVLGAEAQKDEEQDALARMSERQRRTYLRELERERGGGKNKGEANADADSFSEGEDDDDEDLGAKPLPRPPKFDPDMLVKERAAKSAKESGAASLSEDEEGGKQHGVDKDSDDDGYGSGESFEEDSEELDRLDREARQLIGNKDHLLLAAQAASKKGTNDNGDAGSDDEEEDEEEDEEDDE